MVMGTIPAFARIGNRSNAPSVPPGRNGSPRTCTTGSARRAAGAARLAPPVATIPCPSGATSGPPYSPPFGPPLAPPLLKNTYARRRATPLITGACHAHRRCHFAAVEFDRRHPQPLGRGAGAVALKIAEPGPAPRRKLGPGGGGRAVRHPAGRGPHSGIPGAPPAPPTLAKRPNGNAARTAAHRRRAGSASATPHYLTSLIPTSPCLSKCCFASPIR
jgi:hypothetical protein